MAKLRETIVFNDRSTFLIPNEPTHHYPMQRFYRKAFYLGKSKNCFCVQRIL